MASIGRSNGRDLLADPVRPTEARIIEYIRSHRGKSSGLIEGLKAAVKLFFDMNDIVLNWKKISKTSTKCS